MEGENIGALKQLYAALEGAGKWEVIIPSDVREEYIDFFKGKQIITLPDDDYYGVQKNATQLQELFFGGKEGPDVYLGSDNPAMYREHVEFAEEVFTVFEKRGLFNPYRGTEINWDIFYQEGQEPQSFRDPQVLFGEFPPIDDLETRTVIGFENFERLVRTFETMYWVLRDTDALAERFDAQYAGITVADLFEMRGENQEEYFSSTERFRVVPQQRKDIEYLFNPEITLEQSLLRGMRMVIGEVLPEVNQSGRISAQSSHIIEAIQFAESLQEMRERMQRGLENTYKNPMRAMTHNEGKLFEQAYHYISPFVRFSEAALETIETMHRLYLLDLEVKIEDFTIIDTGWKDMGDSPTEI